LGRWGDGGYNIAINVQFDGVHWGGDNLEHDPYRASPEHSFSDLSRACYGYSAFPELYGLSCFLYHNMVDYL